MNNTKSVLLMGFLILAFYVGYMFYFRSFGAYEELHRFIVSNDIAKREVGYPFHLSYFGKIGASTTNGVFAVYGSLRLTGRHRTCTLWFRVGKQGDDWLVEKAVCIRGFMGNEVVDFLENKAP